MKQVVDGLSRYAYTGGRPFDASREVVVFIHGAQNDHSVWILQSRYFAHHGYAVLAVDLPGHGKSEGPALTTIEAQAAWVLGFLDTLGVDYAHLVGHSMGSLVALHAAATAPQRVGSVALLATAYPMHVSPQLLQASRDDEPRAIDMINLWSFNGQHGGFSQKPSNPGPGFCAPWGSQRLMQRQVPGVLSIDFEACNGYRGGEAAADAVTCPTLFLIGERDAMTSPRAAQAVLSRISHAQTTLLPNVGHALMAEAPDAVLDRLFRFVTSSRRIARAAIAIDGPSSGAPK